MLRRIKKLLNQSPSYSDSLCAGEPVFKFRTTERKFPIESGTWNHRLEACYRAMSEQPHNLNVSSVMDRGLRSVKFLDSCYVVVVCHSCCH